METSQGPSLRPSPHEVLSGVSSETFLSPKTTVILSWSSENFVSRVETEKQGSEPYDYPTLRQIRGDLDPGRGP